MNSLFAQTVGAFFYLALITTLQASGFNPKDVLGFSEIHERGVTGRGVVVAIHEDDVADHPLLKDKVVNPEDGRSKCLLHLQGILSEQELANISRKLKGWAKHGSHVAGIIAGQAAKDQHFGVAPGAQIVLAHAIGADIVKLKIRPGSDGLSLSEFRATPEHLKVFLRQAYRRAIDKGARIYNWSGSLNDSFASPEITLKFLKPYFFELVSHNILVVLCAGNESQIFTEYQTSGFYKAVNSLANDPRAKGRILWVGATAGDSYETFYPATFSNTGSRFKPSTWNNLVFAPGQNIESIISKDQLGLMSGTSMAAPYVSGLAALLIEKHPDAPAEVIAEWIKAGCSTNSGYGSMGHGVINARRSFKIAEQATQPRITLNALCLEADFRRCDRVAHLKERYGLSLEDLKPGVVHDFFSQLDQEGSLPALSFFKTLFRANQYNLPASFDDVVAILRSTGRGQSSFFFHLLSFSDRIKFEDSFAKYIEVENRSRNYGNRMKGLMDSILISRAKEDIASPVQKRIEYLEHFYPIPTSLDKMPTESIDMWKDVLDVLNSQLGHNIAEGQDIQPRPIVKVLIHLASREKPSYYKLVSLIYPDDFLAHLESLIEEPVKLADALDLFLITLKTQGIQSQHIIASAEILENSLSSSDLHEVVSMTVKRLPSLDDPLVVKIGGGTVDEDFLCFINIFESYWAQAFDDKIFEGLAHEKDKILRWMRFALHVNNVSEEELIPFWQQVIESNLEPIEMQTSNTTTE